MGRQGAGVEEDLLGSLGSEQPRDAQDAILLREMEALLAAGTAQALENVLAEGNKLLNRKPAPEPWAARQAKMFQAGAMSVLNLSDHPSAPDEVARMLFTNPLIPNVNAFWFLHRMELARAQQLGEQGAQGDPQVEDLKNEHYNRALSYGLMHVAAFSRADFSTQQYNQAIRALSFAQPGGWGDDEKGRRIREAIRRTVYLYLWDATGQRTGQVPWELAEDIRDGDPAAILEGAMLAAGILAIAAEEPYIRRVFGSQHGELSRRIDREHPRYARDLKGRRARLRSAEIPEAQLQGVVPYEEAVRWQNGSPQKRILGTFEDDGTISTPSEYIRVPPEGILVPFGHLALKSGGLRVIDARSLSSEPGAPHPSADWYTLVGVEPGWEFPHLVWEVRQWEARWARVPDKVGDRTHEVLADAISVRMIPEVGLLVAARGEGEIYLERVPGELQFESAAQWALLGLMTEGIEMERLSSPGGDPLLQSLGQKELRYYDNPELGVRITRTGGILNRVRHSGLQMDLHSFDLAREVPPEEELQDLEMLDIRGGVWKLREEEEGLEAVEVPSVAGSSGTDEGISDFSGTVAVGGEPEGQPVYTLTAGLSVSFEKGAWSPDRLREIAGELESGGAPRQLPIKLTDGTHRVLARFVLDGEGRLTVSTEREPVFELQETSRLLVRLAALILQPPEVPEFNSETPLAVLQEMLVDTALQGEGFVRRAVALEALIRHPPEEGGVEPGRTLLEQLSRESSSALTVRIITGLVERHESGFRYVPQQRREVWERLARLLTDRPGGHPNRFVRRAAVQAFARMTPEGEDKAARKRTFDSSIRTLNTVKDSDLDSVVRDLASHLVNVLERQLRFGPETPWQVRPGPGNTGAQTGMEENMFRVRVPVSMKPEEVLMGKKELQARTKEVASQVGAQLVNSKLFLPPSELRADGASPLGLGLVIGSPEDLRLAYSIRDPNQMNLLRLRTLDLYHVLENAVDAIADRTEEEGRVYLGQIEVAAWQEGEDLVLEVSDNGIGIPVVLKPLIFREWFTTKEELTRAGGKGKAMRGGMYGFRLLGNFGGQLEVETLRYTPPGTVEEDPEQPWGLACDPVKDQFSYPERSPENRTEAGTTIRWRFSKALSPAVAAGAEEFEIREFDGSSEDIREELGITEKQRVLVVTPAAVHLPLVTALFAHADLAAYFTGKLPQGVRLQALMHPAISESVWLQEGFLPDPKLRYHVSAEEAKKLSIAKILDFVQTTGALPLVVLNNRYVKAGEELAWVPPELQGRITVLNLPETLVRDDSFTAERLAMLHAIAQRLGGVLSVSWVEFEGNFEGEQAMIVYL